MNLVVWLIVGVVIGCLGSLIMRSEPDHGTALNTGAGIIGALLADWLLTPLLGDSPRLGFFSASVVAVSLLGAVALVCLVNVLRYGRIR